MNRKGKSKLFEPLCGSLLGGEARYSDIAEQVGIAPNAVKVAAHRMRQRLGDLIRSEIANTVDDPAEIEMELQHLMKAMQA